MKLYPIRTFTPHHSSYSHTLEWREITRKEMKSRILLCGSSSLHISEPKPTFLPYMISYIIYVFKSTSNQSLRLNNSWFNFPLCSTLAVSLSNMRSIELLSLSFYFLGLVIYRSSLALSPIWKGEGMGDMKTLLCSSLPSNEHSHF